MDYNSNKQKINQWNPNGPIEDDNQMLSIIK